MRRIGTVLTSIVVTLLLSAGMASALTSSVKPDGEVGPRGGCVGKIYGSVMNESNHPVGVLEPEDYTPPNEDWDGFYVACSASGRIATWTFPGYWVWRDFSLPAGWWMKVSTDQDAHVRSQSC